MLHRSARCLLLLGLLFGTGAGATTASEPPGGGANTKAEPRIELWYGERQRFGYLGDAQPLVNILGTIHSSEPVAAPYYQLNGRKQQQITLGSDLRRLANPGDFNLEIDRRQLKPGENTVHIHFRTPLGKDISTDVVIDYTPDVAWKLPYEVDFSKLENVQDAVEVIDGEWKLTPDGLRTVVPYYDRQIAFGDDGWTDYELYAEVIIHQHLPDLRGRNRGGAPYLSHAHTSFNLRWGGHPDDGFSPRRDWMNLGSLVALRSDLATPKKGSYWWMHFGRAVPRKPAKRGMMTPDERLSIVEGERYSYRMRVETVDKQQARYSTKIWKTDEDEPTGWQLVAIDKSELLSSGGVVFVVHHSDATLCRVRVESLVPKQQDERVK